MPASAKCHPGHTGQGSLWGRNDCTTLCPVLEKRFLVIICLKFLHLKKRVDILLNRTDRTIPPETGVGVGQKAPKIPTQLPSGSTLHTTHYSAKCTLHTAPYLQHVTKHTNRAWVITRPVVAGAVLQTPLSLIHPFPPKSSKYHKSQIVRARELKV